MENRGDTGEQPDHLLAFLFLFFFALARIFKQIISFYLVEIGISLQVKDNLACKGRTLWKILSYTRKGKLASLVAQMIKNLPAMQEMQETLVQSLGWEDSLEKGMATHSSILAWKIQWTEKPGRL